MVSFQRHAVFFACTILVAGCGGAPEPYDQSAAVVTIEGGPTAYAPAERQAISLTASPSAVAVVRESVAVVVPGGLLLGASSTPFASPPLVATPDEPQSTGDITAVARRSGEGLLVASAQGLFHDSDGSLYRSPLSQNLQGLTILSLDAFGYGAAEELWLVTPEGAHHIGDGVREALSVSGAGTLEVAVGADARQAILVGEGIAYLIALDTLETVIIARGLGKVNSFDRDDDGTVYLGTDAGLFSRTRQGATALRTLSHARAAPAKVDAVAASLGTVMVLSQGNVLKLEGESLLTIGTAAPSGARSVTLDTKGDTWLVDSGALARLKTAVPVSYADDVKPFFVTHCTRCHSAGVGGAPPIDYEDYETAKLYAEVVIRRLEAVDMAPMPPASVGVLTARDYAVVERWVGGGMAP